MGDEQRPDVKRVRLTGTRFDGGRLPVDSLVELQKYQDVVRIAAEAEWRQAHPGEEVPADFSGSVSLAIERIDEGSADVFLAFEQQRAYIQYQAEAQDAADAIIVAAYSGAVIPALSALTPEEDVELRETVSRLGETLEPGQSIEFYPDGPGSAPVKITIESRKVAVEHLSRIEDFLVAPEPLTKQSDLGTQEQSLVGKVTALDADKMTYRLVLADGQELHGRYPKHPELFEDLRKVVHSAAEGPLTRITGDLQTREGSFFRFWETSSLEQIQFDETRWGARLVEFAGLNSGWDGDAAEQISSVALEAAQMLLRAIDEAGITSPAVFPTVEGGVLVEWASAGSVRSVEILNDASFETFALSSGQSTGVHATTRDLSVAIQFVRVAKA